jgi:hypothetical protein
MFFQLATKKFEVEIFAEFCKENPKKLIVENLGIINKTKHSTKGRERKGYKMEGPNQVLAKQSTLQMKSFTNRELGTNQVPNNLCPSNCKKHIRQGERGGMNV